MTIHPTRSGEPDPRPNIVLITTDQQRYDTLGVTGNPDVDTPALDALARRGTLFDRAYIQNPVCVPSRACIQTGRYVHQHGVEHMSSVIADTPGLPPWETTMMERLQECGYATAAYGKIHMMPPRGFDESALTMGKGARWTQAQDSPLGPAQLGPVYAQWLDERLPGGYESIYAQRRTPGYVANATALPNVLPAELCVDSWIGQNSVDYIQRQHDTPFFLWTGFCGPHTPFDPPEPYASRYDQASVPLSDLIRATSPAVLMSKPVPELAAAGSEPVHRRMVAYYWGMMTLIDDLVARIVAAVDSTRSRRDTVIIFTTDHGEMLGDFGTFGKANFTEQVIHAPCIVVPPAGATRGSNQGVVHDLVEHVDLAPTILDYAAIPTPAQLPGRSLRPYMESGHARPAARESALCEYTSNDRSRRGKCVRTDQHKYVFNGRHQPVEFYDLDSDPLELINLATDPARASAVRDHAELLLDRLTHTAPTEWNTTGAAQASHAVDHFGRPMGVMTS